MDLHSVWSRMWTLPSPGAASEMGELISKIDSIELSLHSLNNMDINFPHSELDPLTIIHASFKMIGDQA